ncbi:hypothetical protein GHT06_003729 [Daphnia sinensis]|uniref:Uncharacterized protein n=1 Tax=Daphnia sinensis TaxID=1820382 RepID=A0AAD5L1Q9_9CRUS|nr:hypothetical protein GHT06_003729 [Daphnia sinensis]
MTVMSTSSMQCFWRSYYDRSAVLWLQPKCLLDFRYRYRRFPNTLDTDSDGDGCSDAFEGGATSNSGTSVIAGPYGDNGLANSRESSDGIDAVVNYDPTYNLALSKDLNKCIDTDGDGILDVNDIDDDNDDSYGTLSNGSASADYEINLVGVKDVYFLSPITGPVSGSVELAFDNSKGGLHYFFKDDDNVYSQTFRIVPSSPTLLSKIEFGVNVPSNQLSKTSNVEAQSILMTWNPDVKAIVHDPDDQLSTHATGDIISSGATITTNANYTIANSNMEN